MRYKGQPNGQSRFGNILDRRLLIELSKRSKSFNLSGEIQLIASKSTALTQNTVSKETKSTDFTTKSPKIHREKEILNVMEWSMSSYRKFYALKTLLLTIRDFNSLTNNEEEDGNYVDHFLTREEGTTS